MCVYFCLCEFLTHEWIQQVEGFLQYIVSTKHTYHKIYLKIDKIVTDYAGPGVQDDDS